MSDKNKKNKNQQLKNEKPSQRKDNKQKKPNNKDPKQGKSDTLRKNEKPVPKKYASTNEIIRHNMAILKEENTATPSIQNEQPCNKYSKRKIQSNWDRLELPENLYETMENEAHGADMGDLLRKPISIGDHFQFKHEKFWNFDSKSSNENDLFALDLNKISEHIACIPFYKRNDINISLFSEEDIKHMDRIAYISNETLKRKSKNALFAEDSSCTIENSNINVDIDKISSNIAEQCQIKTDDELSELLKTVSKPPKTYKNNAPDTKVEENDNSKLSEDEDLEEWLGEYINK